MPVHSSGGVAASNAEPGAVPRRVWLAVNVVALAILLFDPPSWMAVVDSTSLPQVALDTSPEIQALRATNRARLRKRAAAAKALEDTREVCTAVSSAAAGWYSDLFSYRMRTPDLVARVAIIVIPDDHDFELQRSRLHGVAAVRQLLLERGHVATCACDYDAAWSFAAAPTTTAATSASRTTKRRHLPGGLLPHGTHVAAGLLDVARDALHASGMRTTSLRLRIRRHTRGGGGASDSVGVASVGKALTQEELWARRRVLHRIGTHPNSTPATFAADLAGPGGIAVASIGLTSQPGRYPATRSVAHARYVIALRAVAVEGGDACKLTRLGNSPSLLRQLGGDGDAEDAGHLTMSLDLVAGALALR